jgi:hypothetical protein
VVKTLKPSFFTVLKLLAQNRVKFESKALSEEFLNDFKKFQSTLEDLQSNSTSGRSERTYNNSHSTDSTESSSQTMANMPAQSVTQSQASAQHHVQFQTAGNNSSLTITSHLEKLNNLGDDATLKAKDLKELLSSVMAFIQKPSHSRENLENKIAFTMDKIMRDENSKQIIDIHMSASTVPASLFYHRFPRPISTFSDNSEYMDRYNELIRNFQTEALNLNYEFTEQSLAKNESELSSLKSDLIKIRGETEVNQFFAQTKMRVEEKLRDGLSSGIQKANNITYRKFQLDYESGNDSTSNRSSRSNSRGSRSNSNSGYAPRRRNNNNNNRNNNYNNNNNNRNNYNNNNRNNNYNNNWQHQQNRPRDDENNRNGSNLNNHQSRQQQPQRPQLQQQQQQQQQLQQQQTPQQHQNFH